MYFGAETVACEASCAAAGKPAQTASDNPNKMGLSLFMYSILLDLLRDHALGKAGGAGEERVFQGSSIMQP
jgi:hypothetical protein